MKPHVMSLKLILIVLGLAKARPHQNTESDINKDFGALLDKYSLDAIEDNHDALHEDRGLTLVEEQRKEFVKCIAELPQHVGEFFFQQHN